MAEAVRNSAELKVIMLEDLRRLDAAALASRDAEIARLREGIRAAVKERYERIGVVTDVDGDWFCAHGWYVEPDSGCPECMGVQLTALLETPAPEPLPPPPLT